MPISSFRWTAALLLLLGAAQGQAKPSPTLQYAPALPTLTEEPGTAGAIFRSDYAPLSSGFRAGHIGDVLTVILSERTDSSHANTVSTDRDGSIGLTPPATGPLNLISPSDVKMGGGLSFKGKGQSVQSNALSGEISVTVVEVRNNGTMLVRGEKALSLNRDDERIQLSGIVRVSDVGTDNRIASTRVADARISYFGKGVVARSGRPGWLQRFFTAISPF